MQFDPSKIKAVLFDFDGVIVDSMNDNFNAWKVALGEQSVEIVKKDYFKIEGMKASAVALKYLEDNGMDIGLVPEIVSRKEALFREASVLRVYPGVSELIEKLQSVFKLGVVTGASRDRFSKMTSSLKFFSNFNVIITADDITKGKPDPIPYLTAAEKIGVEPSECLVIENAPLGITSAKAAGMKCIAVKSTLDESYLEEADEVFESIEEINNISIN